jgi:hypothetical protein
MSVGSISYCGSLSFCPSYIGRATAQAVSRRLPGFDPKSDHVTSVADKSGTG